jgi:WhiB family transcriptional regulator, redox-sensing transcriptional regulator
MTSLAWMQLAACQGVPTETMFPSQGADVRTAKAICADCPVTAPCLEYALTTGQHYGIWGGQSERQRVRLRRKWRIANGVELRPNGHPVAGHGTRSRYTAGCRCVDCVDASRAYHRQNRRRPA